jgi:hypothetical protein
VDTNANADLVMRVKALEADVAGLQRRVQILTDLLRSRAEWERRQDGAQR